MLKFPSREASDSGKSQPLWIWNEMVLQIRCIMAFGEFPPAVALYELLAPALDARGRVRGKSHALRTAQQIRSSSVLFNPEHFGFTESCDLLIRRLSSPALGEFILNLPESGAHPLRGTLGEALYPSLLIRPEDDALHIFAAVGLAGRWYLEQHPRGRHLAAFSVNKSFQVSRMARPSSDDRPKLKVIASKVIAALSERRDPGEGWLMRFANESGVSDADCERLDQGLRAFQNGVDALVGWKGGLRKHVWVPFSSSALPSFPTEEVIEDEVLERRHARTNSEGIWQPSDATPGEIVIPWALNLDRPNSGDVAEAGLNSGLPPMVLLSGGAVPAGKTAIRKALDREQAFKQASLSLYSDGLLGSARALATPELLESFLWCKVHLAEATKGSLRWEGLHAVRMIGELAKPAELVVRSTRGPGLGEGASPHFQRNGKVYVSGPTLGRSQRVKAEGGSRELPMKTSRFSLATSRESRELLLEKNGRMPTNACSAIQSMNF